LESVTSATTESIEYIREQENNMFLPDITEQGEQEFWRVDALEGEEVFTGQVWSFHAGEDTTTVLPDTLSNIKFQVRYDDIKLVDASVILDGQNATTDQFGEVIFNDFVNGKSYNYSIQRGGFDDVAGVVFLEKDTIIDINMQLEAGLDMIDQFNINVYPNPAKEILHIDSDQEKFSVEIVNAFGQLVYSKEQQKAKGTIDISALEQGVYIVLITDRNYNRIWKSIVIAR